MSKPIPSPGETLAQQANTIHKDLVQHLLETYGPEQGVAVMLAAAMACRTFLDARAGDGARRKIEPERDVVAREYYALPRHHRTTAKRLNSPPPAPNPR